MEGGEALKQMADLKYALDDNVKQVNRFCFAMNIFLSFTNFINHLLELFGAPASTSV